MSCERLTDKPEEIYTKKYKSQSQDLFNREKALIREIYLEDDIKEHEYELVTDTSELLIIRSVKYKVKQYMCNFDVTFSDVLGNEKRKIITIVLVEKEHDTNNFEITDFMGL